NIIIIIFMKKETVQKLELLFETDQENIKLFKNGSIDGSELKNKQLDNLLEIKNIIKEEGFPCLDVASEKAYNAAFLIIQHAGDIKFMEDIARIFEINIERINKIHLAYLIDRVKILSNKPQLYGTQYKEDNSKKIFFPIEDIENL